MVCRGALLGSVRLRDPLASAAATALRTAGPNGRGSTVAESELRPARETEVPVEHYVR